MVCPECKKEGRKSKVFAGSPVRLIAARGYWDEEGSFVWKDPEVYICSFYCSNEHSWVEIGNS